MKWASALSGDDYRGGAERYGSARDLISECIEKLQFQLGNEQPDLIVGFVSPHFIDEYEDIPRLLKDSKLAPKAFIGCSAGGLIGGGQEVEKSKAVALTAAVLPGVDIRTFHIDDEQLPDEDDPQQAWEKLVGIQSNLNPDFILLPDPFSFKIDRFVRGLDFAFPSATKLGGLASGANSPGMNALFCGDNVYRKGMVGASISGNIVVESIVAQGCRPIGEPLRVTECKSNFLFALDGEPAVNVLRDVLAGLPVHDQELAKHSIFLGVVMDEFKTDVQAGDFLVRNILGIEPKSGALVVGELLRPERTVQFHLRDAATSDEDLRFLLKQYRDKTQPSANDQPQGALLFSCLGRGQYLYGQPNHDSDCFREYLGEIPLGGFFCNGEIGPVGGTTFLHGYTSSFAIFKEKEPVKQ